MVRRMQPLVPGFGGTTLSAANLPLPAILIWNTPLPDFLIWTPLIAPLNPVGSLYLKPLTASPLQVFLPEGRTTCGRLNVWAVELPPKARMVSVAPETVGLPTSVFGLAFSF